VQGGFGGAAPRLRCGRLGVAFGFVERNLTRGHPARRVTPCVAAYRHRRSSRHSPAGLVAGNWFRLTVLGKARASNLVSSNGLGFRFRRTFLAIGIQIQRLNLAVIGCFYERSRGTHHGSPNANPKGNPHAHPLREIGPKAAELTPSSAATTSACAWFVSVQRSGSTLRHHPHTEDQQRRQTDGH
jgi:hypothetical protein